MSWQNLPTDYENIQWNGQRKYQIVENQDGTVSFVDVTDYLNDNKAQMAASELNRMTGGVNDLRNGINIAGTFDAATSYNIGDYVFYDGTLYRFTAAHTGAWNASHAVVVLITSELMSRLTDAPSDGNEYVRKNGAWVVPAGSGAATWGSISGTLADQTDLQAALNGKAASSHTHSYNSLTGKPTLGAMAAEADAPSDSKEYVRKNGNWVESSGGGSGAATWGSISGTLANQTDLKNALDAKANTADLGDLADHDQVDYETEVTNKPNTFPPATHIHDDRYYTESETDALLDEKASVIIGPVPVKLSGTYIVVPVGAKPIDFKAILQVTQTGSGTPSASNIRPFESAEFCVVVESTDYADVADEWWTRNIPLPSAMYGGIVDVMNGTVIITHGHIASYNGETLPGVWYSDRDVYASGTTPTIGAEVVYELETPIEQTCDSYTPTMFSNRDTYLWASHQSMRLSVTNYTVAGAIDIYEQGIIDTKTYIDTALAGKQNTLTFDSAPTASSTNPVESGGVKTALDAKQDTLTFDTTPTANSTNPVTSGGIQTALDEKANTADLGTLAGKDSVSYTEITDKPTTFPPSAHNHSAGDITSGTLGTARGGTGITSNPSMLVNLGSTSAASVFASAPRPGITGTLPIGHGGTGSTNNTGWKSITASTFSGTIYYRVIGPFVSFVGYGLKLASELTTSSVTLVAAANSPLANYAPKTTQSFPAGNNQGFGQLMINSNGSISFFRESSTNWATTRNIHVSGFYAIE